MQRGIQVRVIIRSTSAGQVETSVRRWVKSVSCSQNARNITLFSVSAVSIKRSTGKEKCTKIKCVHKWTVTLSWVHSRSTLRMLFTKKFSYLQHVRPCALLRLVKLRTAAWSRYIDRTGRGFLISRRSCAHTRLHSEWNNFLTTTDPEWLHFVWSILDSLSPFGWETRMECDQNKFIRSLVTKTQWTDKVQIGDRSFFQNKVTR